MASFNDEEILRAYITGAEETLAQVRDGLMPDDETVGREAVAYLAKISPTPARDRYVPAWVKWMDRNVGWLLLVMVLGVTLAVCLSR